jgi:hypothetical protein
MDSLIRSAALLGLAALLCAAQEGGQGGGVGNLPPEIAAQLPPGAVLESSVSLGPSVSDGEPVFDAPQPLGAPLLPESVPLAQDGVVASETLQLLPLHFRLSDPVAIGPPFKYGTPAGSDVGRLVKDGGIRHCIRHHGIYRPAEDGSGEIYPALCFEDRDGDGRYETAILLPYHPQQAQPRVMAIAPVRLDPNPADGQNDPHALRFRRRIRIVHVGPDEARIVAEQGIATTGEADVTSYVARPQDSLTLRLREGASGSLGGIALRLRRDGTGWRVAATGRLAPWLEVRENGNLIVAGGMEYRRRLSP